MRFRTVRQAVNKAQAYFDVNHEAPPANKDEIFIPEATNVNFVGAYIFITFVYAEKPKKGFASNSKIA